MENNNEVLLKVDHLCQYFRLGRKDLKAVDDVSFDIKKGECNIVLKGCGTSINLDVEKIFLLGSLNIFGKPKANVKKSDTQSFGGFLPESGDFVVHTTHGIGKCVGIECLQLTLSKRD